MFMYYYNIIPSLFCEECFQVLVEDLCAYCNCDIHLYSPKTQIEYMKSLKAGAQE